MTDESTQDTNKVEQQLEPDPLMAAYNPQPLKAEKRPRFYWEESPQETALDGAVQAAFES